jgi:hypothetical protein
MFVGRRGAGKSFLMQDILSYFSWIPEGIVFSATEECNKFWGQHFPGSFIFPEYKPEIMGRVINKQRLKALMHERDPRIQLDPVVVLGEDIFFDKNAFTKDKNARYAMMNGRHVNMLLLLSVQYMMDMSRDLRSSVDYLFVLRDNVIGNRERLWKNWFGVVPTFDAFNAIMTHFTENRGCIVLDVQCLSNNIEDCVFWYRAKNRGDYKVGSKGYWMWHHINKKDQLEIEKELMDSLVGDKDEKKKKSYRIRKAI